MEIDQFVNSFDKEYSEEPEPKSDSGSILGRLYKNFTRGGSSPREDITHKKCALIRAFAFDTSSGSPKLSEGYFLEGARAVNPSLIKSIERDNFTPAEIILIDKKFKEISDKVEEYKQFNKDLHTAGSKELVTLLGHREFTEAFLSENEHGICPLEKFLANEKPEYIQKLLFTILENSESIPDAGRFTEVVMKSIQNKNFLSQGKIFKGISRGLSEHFDYKKKGQEAVLKAILGGAGSSKIRSVLAYRAIQCMDIGKFIDVPISLLTLAISSVKPGSQVAKIMSLASASGNGGEDISKAFVMSQHLSAEDLKKVLEAVKDPNVRARIVGSFTASNAVMDKPEKLEVILASLANGKLKDAVILKNKDYLLGVCASGTNSDSSLTILKHTSNKRVTREFRNVLLKVGTAEEMNRYLSSLSTEELNGFLGTRGEGFSEDPLKIALKYGNIGALKEMLEKLTQANIESKFYTGMDHKELKGDLTYGTNRIECVEEILKKAPAIKVRKSLLATELEADNLIGVMKQFSEIIKMEGADSTGVLEESLGLIIQYNRFQLIEEALSKLSAEKIKSIFLAADRLRVHVDSIYSVYAQTSTSVRSSEVNMSGKGAAAFLKSLVKKGDSKFSTEDVALYLSESLKNYDINGKVDLIKNMPAELVWEAIQKKTEIGQLFAKIENVELLIMFLPKLDSSAKEIFLSKFPECSYNISSAVKQNMGNSMEEDSEYLIEFYKRQVIGFLSLLPEHQKLECITSELGKEFLKTFLDSHDLVVVRSLIDSLGDSESIKSALYAKGFPGDQTFMECLSRQALSDQALSDYANELLSRIHDEGGSLS